MLRQCLGKRQAQPPAEWDVDVHAAKLINVAVKILKILWYLYKFKVRNICRMKIKAR
jgi:hypothetical protein